MVLTPDEACDVARNQYDGRSDQYDIYCSWDFPGRSLSDFINELEQEGNDA